jgi:hypothetical protein
MPAGRHRYKTARDQLMVVYMADRAWNFRVNCRLFFGGFGNGGVHYFRPAAAEEKSQMPRAALAAAERPQEQEKQYGPLQDAAAVRPQNILASA